MTPAGAGAAVRHLWPLPVPKGLGAPIERILGVHRAQEMYEDLLAMHDNRCLCERLLSHLEIRYRVPDRDLERIPRRGALILTVNHPYGILDGAILAALLPRLRADVKFLANHILMAIPEIRDLLIPVDPAAGSAAPGNGSGLRTALDFVAGGGALVVFPAGAVAHFQWKARSVSDPEWQHAVARFIGIAGRRARNLSLAPAYLTGGNSLLFQAAGLLDARLRTALLARELMNKRGHEIELRFGNPIPAERLLAIPNDRERIEYLRWRTELLACRNTFKPRASLPLRSRGKAKPPEPVVAAVAADALAREVDALRPEARLASSGELDAYLAAADAIPAVLAEIGRLREIAFRAAGEGAGKACDLDSFDPHYLHLFLWNREKREVVGAYRLAGTDWVRPRFGIRGLYTAALFEYGDEFLDRLGPALELGRSFVRLEYRRAFAPLLLLWKGIGRYVAANARYRVLFGPVSISNQYHSVSRQIMVSFLKRHAWMEEWAGLVSSRNPFRARASRAWKGNPPDIEDVSAAVADIEPGQPGVPVLLRQYLKLGGRLLGFNVDPNFADALDGLIVVDLTRTAPNLLERYLGKAEAASFLAFQRGFHEKQPSTTHDFELGAARRGGADSAADPVVQVHRSR